MGMSSRCCRLFLTQPARNAAPPGATPRYRPMLRLGGAAVWRCHRPVRHIAGTPRSARGHRRSVRGGAVIAERHTLLGRLVALFVQLIDRSILGCISLATHCAGPMSHRRTVGGTSLRCCGRVCSGARGRDRAVRRRPTVAAGLLGGRIRRAVRPRHARLRPLRQRRYGGEHRDRTGGLEQTSLNHIHLLLDMAGSQATALPVAAGTWDQPTPVAHHFRLRTPSKSLVGEFTGCTNSPVASGTARQL
jgi:hypothetical protein